MADGGDATTDGDMTGGEDPSGSRLPFTVRPVRDEDVEALRLLLNDIVRVGGTTAIETPLDTAEFTGYFLGSESVSCVTAVREDGVLLGFQALERHRELSPGWADIATFARLGHHGRGVGAALFRSTLEAATRHGIVALNATIRADNVGGLAFYSRLGFVDHAVDESVPLRSGVLVDRVSKKYPIGNA